MKWTVQRRTAHEPPSIVDEQGRLIAEVAQGGRVSPAEATRHARLIEVAPLMVEVLMSVVRHDPENVAAGLLRYLRGDIDEPPAPYYQAGRIEVR